MVTRLIHDPDWSKSNSYFRAIDLWIIADYESSASRCVVVISKRGLEMLRYHNAREFKLYFLIFSNVRSGARNTPLLFSVGWFSGLLDHSMVQKVF